MPHYHLVYHKSHMEWIGAPLYCENLYWFLTWQNDGKNKPRNTLTDLNTIVALIKSTDFIVLYFAWSWTLQNGNNMKMCNEHNCPTPCNVLCDFAPRFTDWKTPRGRTVPSQSSTIPSSWKLKLPLIFPCLPRHVIYIPAGINERGNKIQ
jgi:hypothetical protein